MLNSYGTDDIISIAAFYDQPKVIKDNLGPITVNKEALEEQHKSTSYLFWKILNRILKGREKQTDFGICSQQAKLRRKAKKVTKIHFRNRNKIMGCLTSVGTSQLYVSYFGIAALIPSSTAKVEHSFSLMKLICTRFQKMCSKTLSNRMRICEFREMLDKDYNI